MRTAKLFTASVLFVAMIGLGSAQSVDTEPGFVQPESVSPGQDVSNQLFNVKINALSADGDTDYVYFQFPDEFAGSLSPNTVDSNISVASSNSVVDYDEDGNQETVEVGLSEDGNSSVYTNITLDTGVSYPQNFDDFEVEVTVEDSANGEDSTTLQVKNADAASDDTSDSTSDSSDSTEDSDSTDESTEDTTDTGNQDTSGTGSSDDSTGSDQDSQDESSEGGFISGIVSFFTGLF